LLIDTTIPQGLRLLVLVWRFTEFICYPPKRSTSLCEHVSTTASGGYFI